MSETDARDSGSEPSGPKTWEPNEDGYEGHFALLVNGTRSDHVVDTTTFDTSLSAPANYDGHAASVGMADTLCGRNLLGRMIPLEQEFQLEQSICGHCLKALRAREVEDDE